MQELRDKVAAITGAASGIGRALALELAGRGADLAICDVDEAGLERTAVEAEARGVRVTHDRVDVADRSAVHGWADSVVAAHGRVNLAINNAGVALNATIEKMSYDDLDWLMGINFWGVVHGTRAFLPHLIDSGDGHVVNISSAFGLIAAPGQSAYNSAKFAVRGFTECLRQELALDGHPVSATCVHPGGVRTNIVRNGRLGDDAEARREAESRFERSARTSAERAATKILKAVVADRRRVLVGFDARLIDIVQRIAPTGYQRLLTAAVRRTGPPI